MSLILYNNYSTVIDAADNNTVTCMHCGTVFTSKTGNAKKALSGHIRSCRKRVLCRLAVFDGVIVVLLLNPDRRTMSSINAFLVDNKGNIDMIAGMLDYLKRHRDIQSYHLFEPKNSPDIIKKNGVHSLKRITEALGSEDAGRLEAFVLDIHNRRYSKEG